VVWVGERDAMAKRILAALILMLTASAAAAAGELYIYDDDPQYWWYWSGTPNYEVLVPSNRSYYLDQEWSGHTYVMIPLRDGGPHLFIGTVPGTDTARLWQALSAPWALPLRSSRVTEDTQITTSQGLRARFWVMTGTMQDGSSAMIRMVAFTRDGRTAYLMFVGKESDYTGNIRQYWLRAVNSFRWR